MSIADHAEAHRQLYETHGKREDWIAWQTLSKSISKEELIRELCSLGGKKSQPTLRELKICSYYNEEKRNSARAKAIDSCRKNGSGFHSSALQAELGKRGGSKNKGFVWLTDGTVNIKYSPKRQLACSIERFIEDNPTFFRGRTDTNRQVQCPYCGKVGSHGAMVLHHFKNCKKRETNEDIHRV